MQENPNSRWQNRPSVASHTFCRSPGGPPAAATIVSPARACSCSRPMTWPWVSSAPVSGTMSPKSAGIEARSNAVSGSSAAARTGSHSATFDADLVLPRLPGWCTRRPCTLVGERGEGALGVADDAGGAEPLARRSR